MHEECILSTHKTHVKTHDRLVISHPKSFFLGGLFLLGLLLEFVVRHGDNGQDQIYKVKRTQEDNHNEEEHVPRSS